MNLLIVTSKGLGWSFFGFSRWTHAFTNFKVIDFEFPDNTICRQILKNAKNLHNSNTHKRAFISPDLISQERGKQTIMPRTKMPKRCW